MVSYFKNVSASLKREKVDEFKKNCEERGVSIHTDIKNYVESVLKNGGKQRNVGKNEANSQGRSDGGTTEALIKPKTKDPERKVWFWN